MKRKETEGQWFRFAVVAALLFFCSGFAGLVFEMVWTRMFPVVAGGTTRALSAVLSAYMAGLALGSYLGGRFADRRVSRPFLVYGIIEGLVGLFGFSACLAIPWLLPVLKAGKAFLGQGAGFELFRFLVSALALLVPAALMGATFPVLFRGLLRDRSRFGRVSGFLYAANTLGAVCGSLASAFLLVPRLGLIRTAGIAGLVDVGVFAAAVVIPWLRNLRGEAALVESEPEPEPGQGRASYLYGVLLFGYGLSGLCAMVYQVCWARTLSLSLGNTTYALGLIFASYIAGLALGGAVMAGFADRLRRPLLVAGALEAVVGLSGLAVIPAFEGLVARMFGWTVKFQGDFSAFYAFRFAAGFSLILVPTVAMGALLPLVVRVAGSLKRGVGEPAGQVYAANTVGALVGSFSAGYLFISRFGLQGSLIAAALLNLAVGVAWILLSPGRVSVRLWAAVGAAAAFALTLGLVPRWDPILMNSGPFVYAEAFQEDLEAGEDIRDVLHNYFKVLFHEEGMEATVSVLELRATGDLFLRINGKTDASTSGDMPSQVLCSHIPLLLHPSPKTVMILGLASGVSTGSALLHPVERVDCVEISPAVVRAARLFDKVSRVNYQDPRLRLIVDDARNFLALSDEKYDAIILEQTNPWIAGISTTYTKEFFELVKKHLNPGGLAISFIPLYDLDVPTMKLVLRTLLAVFPEASLWETYPLRDYFALLPAGPFKVDMTLLEQRTSRPALAEDLRRVGVLEGKEILARFVMGPEKLKMIAGEGQVHTDDRRQLEFLVPKIQTRPREERITEIGKLILSLHHPADELLKDLRPFASLLADYDLYRHLYYRASLLNLKPDKTPEEFNLTVQAYRNVMELAEGKFPSFYAGLELAPLLVAQAEAEKEAGEEERAAALLEEAFRLSRYESTPGDELIRFYREKGERNQLRIWAQAVLARFPGDAYALQALGELALEEGRPEQAEQYFRQGAASMPKSPEFPWKLAIALASQGKVNEAEEVLRNLIAEHPELVEPLVMLADLLASQGKTKEAAKLLDRAKEKAPGHPLLRQVEEKYFRSFRNP